MCDVTVVYSYSTDYVAKKMHTINILLQSILKRDFIKFSSFYNILAFVIFV